MKTFTTLALSALFLASTAQAKIWRVNNTVGVTADFTIPNDAVAAAAPGDTIHIESAPGYSILTLDKRLVVRGTGYFLNDTANTRTQHLKDVGFINTITMAPGSKSSIIEGVSSYNFYLQDSFVTIQRCYIAYLNLSTVRDAAGDTIRHCFIDQGIYYNGGNYNIRGLFIYNNIVRGQISFTAAHAADVDGYAINNTFTGNNAFLTENFIYQNNIFNSSSFGTSQGANAFLNNVSSDANLPSGNGNVRSASIASLFAGGATGTGYSTDGRYMLRPGSPAIGAGLLNNVAVDCGAFGGPAPYVLSGMPPMPSIYSISMPSQINAGTSSVSITVSAASH